jgi:hypothetical protein
MRSATSSRSSSATRPPTTAGAGCASCHPDGLSDNVTWIFATGPRNTIALDAFFAKDNPGDQRISNYSAVMGSITDFNNNARGVQGGKGFAGDPPNPNIFNHGFTQGASDSLDAMTLWVQTIRTPLMPGTGDVAGGRRLFETECASCHGGAKWTKSQVVYLEQPDLRQELQRRRRCRSRAACGGGANPCLTVAGTADRVLHGGRQYPRLPRESRDLQRRQPARDPQRRLGAFGALGFNVPSLLGAAYNAPFFHDGSAQTLAEAFSAHASARVRSPPTFNAGQEQALIDFVASIDGRTDAFESDTDGFKDLLTP